MKGNKICIKKTHILLSILAVSIFAIIMAFRSVSNAPTSYKSRASDTRANLLAQCSSRVGDPCCTNQGGKSYCDEKQGLACYKKDINTVSMCVSEDSVWMEEDYSLYKDGKYPPNKITGFFPGTNGYPCLMKDNSINNGWNDHAFNGIYLGVCVEQGTSCLNLRDLENKEKDTTNLQPWLLDLPSSKELASPFDAFYKEGTAKGGVCVKKMCGSDRQEACYDGERPYCFEDWRLKVRYVDPETSVNGLSSSGYLGCIDSKESPIVIKFSNNSQYVQPVSVVTNLPNTANIRYDLNNNEKYYLDLIATSYSKKPYNWTINCDIGLNRNNSNSLSYSSSIRDYSISVNDIISACGLKPGLGRMKISLMSDESKDPINREILISIN